MQNKCVCGCERTGGAYECYRCNQTFRQICVNYISTLQKFCCFDCYRDITVPWTNTTWSMCCREKSCACGCGLRAYNVCVGCEKFFSSSCARFGSRGDYWGLRHLQLRCFNCYRNAWPTCFANQPWSSCCAVELINLVFVLRLLFGVA